MNITEERHRKLMETIAAMRLERQPWWEHWRTLADYLLPRRYIWLQSAVERERVKGKNPNILDSTGTMAARTLASGMMNGITSPARPWFKLRAIGFADDMSMPARIWLDEVERRMMLVMAESNFYNSLAVMYLDLVVFGSACTLIYDDDETTIHCYNPALGEFYFSQSAQHRVNGLGREFWYKVDQVVEEFGYENCSEMVQNNYNRGGASRKIDVQIMHIIEPYDEKYRTLPKGTKFVECYWERAGSMGTVLREKGYQSLPLLGPRWDVIGNDVYGSSPAMDALGDIIQLQHETKKKAQGLDKMVSPPLIADVQLENKPTAFLPNGITFVHGMNNIGAKPVYTVSLPIGELGADIQDIRARIRQIFHNDLFQMISQLDTVRSAAEIDARREEKLVLLGPVLERFEAEGLNPAIHRVFSIMLAKGLIPPAPKELQGRNLDIQYTSILATAQAAVGTAATERWLQLIGALAQTFPEAKAVPDIPGLVADYGRDVGVPEKNIRTPEQVQQVIAQANQDAQAQQQLAMARGAAEGAKTLAQAPVGGGRNALEQMLGGQ